MCLYQSSNNPFGNIFKARNPEEVRQQFLQFHSTIADQSQKTVHKLLGDKFKVVIIHLYILFLSILKYLLFRNCI